MNNSLRLKLTPVLKKIIKQHTEHNVNSIFVLVGITPYVDMKIFADHIADVSTFNKEGNEALFNNEWFVNILNKLSAAQNFQILSHQQFSYICNYISENFFKERIVIIFDNLRSLFPLKKEDYLESNNVNSYEERPYALPIYQAEQQKISNRYYYTLISYSDTFSRVEEFFAEASALECGVQTSGCEVLDVISNPYSIDGFVNQCIEECNFNKRVFVEVHEKNVLNRTIYKKLEKLNHLLGTFGGGVYTLQEEAIKKNYTPQPQTIALLKQYWGKEASFRELSFYENPNINNDVISLSQGLLVETIINEYEKGCRGESPRDIFITAPTGSGKSLIFQLPAFYAAQKGDVTIVVTPLKALMEDQVVSLQNQRHYDRVEYINSNLTLIDRDKIIDSCKKGEIDILYLSPELLLSYDIHYFLGERKLGLLIVDEAHLITTWGRDFRVDYWFLGNHINKIRKFNDYKFPLVALTATAVYGGDNDMVFDSISSLNMHEPHKFIGNVRRNDIEFVIDTHDDYTSNYDCSKENETISFVKGINDLGLKAIVYAPYLKHVENLKSKADAIDPTIAVAYHGKLSKELQNESYKAFKLNQCKIMISTKAFGMGVDIPDIHVVYHHAPSGLLPDYVQEIGRVARDENIQGFAALTFSQSDLRYSKQLHGISSIKEFQLQAVLRKIICCFKMKGKDRNLLVSANDFAYIFNTTEDVNQKVATALMMIEKDYLEKTRFNVLIARPKKLFTKVYARTTDIGIERLTRLYGKCFTEASTLGGEFHIIKLNLEDIWSEHFSDRSFPQFKKGFYCQQFLSEYNIELVPQLKITITLIQSYQSTLYELSALLNSIHAVFSKFKHRGHFFTKEEFVKSLSEDINCKYNVEKIAEFVLATYSGRLTPSCTLEGDSFLQQRQQYNQIQYQVYSTTYDKKIAQLLRWFSKLYANADKQIASKFLSINETPLKDHIRIGSLLEIMNLGTFETMGGEDPKIFLRLNDPSRIEKDSTSPDYKNSVLESVKKRHKVSCQLFEYFFTNYFSSDRRWDMIEDFFLGMSNDELFEKYPSAMINHVNILEHLKENAQTHKNPDFTFDSDTIAHAELFKPKADMPYSRDSLLTIERKTMAVKDWLIKDPVALHRIIVEYKIRIPKDDFNVLTNKLRINHSPYYRDFMRLELLIEFPGYPNMVKAKVPYSECPVKFYKWWKVNTNKVKLNALERINLFLAVDAKNPKALLKAHRSVIKK